MFNCDICKVEYVGSPAWVASHYGASVQLTDTGEYLPVREMCDECYVKFMYVNVKRANCPCCSLEMKTTTIFKTTFTHKGTDIMCAPCVRTWSFMCGECGKRHYIGDTVRTMSRDGSYICPSCIDSFYIRCTECHEYVREQEVSDEDEGTCTRCWHRLHPPRRIVHDYNYRPNVIYHGKRDASGKTMFFGCELEVYVDYAHTIDSKGKEVLNALNDGDEENHVYLKNDSSIGRGFEIVTHPHTYDEIRKLWEERWKENIEGLSSHVAGTCGFHVHISRRALTPMHIQKLVVFINAPENTGMIRYIAQRDCTSYAVLKPDKKLGACGYNADRYEAINLQNEYTIEFRIFRGNLRKDRIMKNLEFVKAAVDFTRDRSYRDLSFNNFAAFVTSERKQFPNLSSYLLNHSSKDVSIEK